MSPYLLLDKLTQYSLPAKKGHCLPSSPRYPHSIGDYKYIDPVNGLSCVYTYITLSSVWTVTRIERERKSKGCPSIIKIRILILFGRGEDGGGGSSFVWRRCLMEPLYFCPSLLCLSTLATTPQPVQLNPFTERYIRSSP